MKKIACITLDVEKDYGQEHIKGKFIVDEILIREQDQLKRLFHPLNLKPTAFVVGKVLEENPSIVDALKMANFELGLHSYSHDLKRDPAVDVCKGVEAYKDAVGRNPIGYRAPQGVITPQEVEILREFRFKYDSSIFPFLRFGKYCNITAPLYPYYIYGSSILELPFASVPFLRFPIALSYMMFLGWNIYETMFRIFGLPRILIFDFHLHDIFCSKSFSYLSKPWKIFYSVIYKRDPWKHFLNFIYFLREQGYIFVSMKHLSEEILKRNKPSSFPQLFEDFPPIKSG